MLLIALYGVTGAAAFLAPGTTSRIFAVDETDRTSEVLFLMRAFGALAIFIATLLFFFIVNSSASRRLMLTAALYEGLVAAGAVLAYSADDLSGRTAAISASGSLLLGLLGLWGGLFTRGQPDEAPNGAKT
jgi:hypothetical protein